MTPPQPPQSNGPTSSMPAGVGQDPAPFAETDLFPVLEDGVTPDKRGERSLPLFTAWGPPPPTGAGPSTPIGTPPPPPPRTGAGPSTPQARAATAPPSNLALISAAVRSHRSMIVIVALTAALAVSCGTLIGVLAFASDGSSGGQQAAPPVTSIPVASTPTSAPVSTTRPVTTTAESSTSTSSTSTTASTTGVATAPSTAPGPAPSTAPDPNALVADFRWSPDPAVAGQSITVVDQSTGGPTRWVWTWNGNVVKSSSQPKGFTTSLRQPTAVTLTVCRGSGNSACASVTKVIPVS